MSLPSCGRAIRRGQQQARLEVGEPCRHHEIVGRELEPYPARLGDVRQILVDQRHHRDAQQIDLLVAGKRQQQVERTFEAFEIDDQLSLARRDHVGSVGAEAVIGERRGWFAHAGLV
jgi:hypothetical protein